jgi:hypothetical protein
MSAEDTMIGNNRRYTSGVFIGAQNKIIDELLTFIRKFGIAEIQIKACRMQSVRHV